MTTAKAQLYKSHDNSFANSGLDVLSCAHTLALTFDRNSDPAALSVRVVLTNSMSAART